MQNEDESTKRQGKPVSKKKFYTVEGNIEKTKCASKL
jgi:hypothetical protein